MSDRHSDADLIRICLEGSAEDLTESVVARINERISESVLLREAINESPMAAAIKELVTLPVETRENSEAAAANGGGSRSLKMLAALLIAGLSVGAGLWWNAQNSQVASPVAPTSEGVGSETVDRRDGTLSPDANRSSDTGFEAEEQAIVDSGSRPDNDDGQSESPPPPNVVADSAAPPDDSNSTTGNGEVGAAKVAEVANIAVAASAGSNMTGIPPSLRTSTRGRSSTPQTTLL